MAGGAGSPPDIPAQDEDGVGRPRVSSGYGRRGPGTGRSEQEDDKSGRGVGTHGKGDDTDAMGFDPQRSHRRRPSDVLYVGATVVIGILLVAWALFR